MDKPNKAKVVKKKDTGLLAIFGGRVWVPVAAVFTILLLLAMAMPVATIPGFSFLAGMLGITPSSMRTLTLADVLAYAAGMDGGRVAAMRYADGSASGYSSGYSSYDFRGGLSAISLSRGSRLFDAREAYRREYELTGKYRPVKGSLGSNIYGFGSDSGGYGYNPNGYYEGVSMPAADDARKAGAAPIIDAERVGPGGEYGPGYGAPIPAGRGVGESGSNAYSDLGPLLGTPPGKPLKPVNPFDISGAGKNVRSDEMVEGMAKGFKSGRLGAMGGVNALGNRVGTRMGSMGAYGAWGDVGRSYFFSYNANMTRYKTNAKMLAEAAFDGSELSDETILVPGEQPGQPAPNTLTPPSTIANKLRQSANKCSAVQPMMGGIYKDSKDFRKRVADMQQQRLPNVCPGYSSVMSDLWWIRGLFCLIPVLPQCYYNASMDNPPSGLKMGEQNAYREAWDAELDGIYDDCTALKKDIDKYTGECGMAYSPTGPGKRECSDILELKSGDPWSIWDIWWNFGNDYNCFNRHRMTGNYQLTSTYVERVSTEVLNALQDLLVETDFSDLEI